MSLQFDPETHTYYVDGEPYPSVTQIIRATSEGADKYDDIPDAVLKRAAAKGNLTHEAIQRYHQDGAPLISDDEGANAYIIGYAQFLQSGMFEWEDSEFRLYCDCHRYAGTVDLVGKVNGKPSVLDIKTTSNLDHEYVGLQTAAYRHLWAIRQGDDPSKYHRWAVWLKTRDYELVPLQNDLDWAKFRHATNQFYEEHHG